MFWRVYIIFFLSLMIASGIIARLFIVQVVEHRFYLALAKDQQQFFEELFPIRGEIFIQDKDSSTFIPLGVNRDFMSVYLVPRDLDNETEQFKRGLAQYLAEFLEIAEEVVFAKLNKTGDPYEPLKNKISDDLAEKLKNEGLLGVYFAPQSWRWYPQNELASHLIGFVGFQGDKKIGQYGLEGFYEADLAGELGFLESNKDAKGRWVATDFENYQPARNGDALVLTIDQNIQYLAEEKLREVINKWQAESGTIIIQDPRTGAIRALANWPNFNPNQYFEVENIDIFLNSAIQKLFEPGSIFKVITMAAGLDSGKIMPETTYFDEGFTRIGGYIINNAANKKYGLSTMTKVLEKSINTGAVFVQKQVGQKIFNDYINSFGLDNITKIDLEGEVMANINNLESGREINYATASFGQGIALTPIQMTSAISAIANQGQMMKPYLVEEIIKADGSHKIVEPQILRQPITAQTAATLTDMLVSVARESYGKIKIGDYYVAAKTGTAQIPDLEKGSYSDETIHGFIGYAPAYQPAFVIFIKIDKPQGIRFAADSLSPTFGELTRFLLNYYEIPPDL